jgi:microtubule-associated protein-like 6
VGLDHIKFWADGKGSMGKLTGKWDPMFCVTQIDGKYISGGGSGAIYTWGGGSGTKIEAHKNGKVHALLVDSKKNLYSGGDDGSIIYWKASGNSLTKQVEIVNMGKLSSLLPGVLSLDINKSEDRLLVCTKGSEIFEVNLKKPMEENCLMKSHFAGELWACTFSPESDQFVTAGDDKTLRVYNVSDRKMQYSYKMANMVRSVDW